MLKWVLSKTTLQMLKPNEPSKPLVRSLSRSVFSHLLKVVSRRLLSLSNLIAPQVVFPLAYYLRSFILSLSLSLLASSSSSSSSLHHDNPLLFLNVQDLLKKRTQSTRRLRSQLAGGTVGPSEKGKTGRFASMVPSSLLTFLLGPLESLLSIPIHSVTPASSFDVSEESAVITRCAWCIYQVR